MRPKTAALVSWGVAGGLAVIVAWLVLARLILANIVDNDVVTNIVPNILDIHVVTTLKILEKNKSHLMEWWRSMERESSLAGHHQALAHLPALALAHLQQQQEDQHHLQEQEHDQQEQQQQQQ